MALSDIAPEVRHSIQQLNSKNWVVVESTLGMKSIISTHDSAVDAGVAAAEAEGRRREETESTSGASQIVQVNRAEIGAKIVMPYGNEQVDWVGETQGHHDVSRGRRVLRGGRKSYDDVLVKETNRYLQRYGVKVETANKTIGEEAIEMATDVEGLQRTYLVAKRFAEAHPNIRVAGFGDGTGWLVISDNGVVQPTVYDLEYEAVSALENLLQRNTHIDAPTIKVYSFPLTEEMRNEHKNGNMPMFHRGRGMFGGNRVLQDHHKKIFVGVAKRETLRQRAARFRASIVENGLQNAVDRFHGIKRALENVNFEDDGTFDPYLHARLSTGLDGIMRGVMEWGYPVWRDGIVDHDGGAGLLDILEPVANVLEEWGSYMAARRARRLMGIGKERLMSEEQIEAFLEYGNQFPMFEKVAKDYEVFNKKVLDFAQESGIIDAAKREVWEHADYVPFWRVMDSAAGEANPNAQWMHGLGRNAGLADQRSPIIQLTGGKDKLGDIVNNITMNFAKLIDTSIKNHAALLTVDALQNTGTIHDIPSQPMDVKKRIIPKKQLREILEASGIDPDTLPDKVFQGLAEMYSIEAPSGPGVISVMRAGKREYYHTEDKLLWKAMTAIDMAKMPRWMNILRAPKRFYTATITLAPAFAVKNYVRDFLSAWVTSRDLYIPFWKSLKGFHSALLNKEDYRRVVSAGAAFDSGYLNYGDPNSTFRAVRRSLRAKGFRQRTVLDAPGRLYEGYKALLSAAENANRMAVYNAALAAGKSRARAVFEAKDLMDFSMGGSAWAAQFLIQTVPFMNARAQGIYRLQRGATEIDASADTHFGRYAQPYAFLMKGMMLMAAGMALFLKYRDDPRYEELDDYMKDGFYNWWIGDHHFVLPKPFEVGALFNTVPERAWQYFEDKYKLEIGEDGLKLVPGEDPNAAWRNMKDRLKHMVGETFAANPIPQAVKPFIEDWRNRDFFTDREIVTYYEQQRAIPQTQARYYTSPTIIELTKLLSPLPEEYSSVPTLLRSPRRLEHLVRGYTGTLGRYALMATDAAVRNMMEYPAPPAISPNWKDVQAGDMATLENIKNWPFFNSFYKGTPGKGRTKYEQRFYDHLRATSGVSQSMSWLARNYMEERYDWTEENMEEFYGVAPTFEGYRESISGYNREIMAIYTDEGMDPWTKRTEIESLQMEKNELFKEAFEFRPGGPENPETPLLDATKLKGKTQDEVIAALEGKTPITASLLKEMWNMPEFQQVRLKQ
jgi:hypothetical protein